jgi:hypothetical protein
LNIGGILRLIQTIILAVFLGVCVSAADTHAQTGDSNIIIFSESHGQETYTTKKSGLLKLDVSTFSSIQRIEINGSPAGEFAGTRAQVEHAFQLEDKETAITVSVVTEDGSLEKTFTIFLGEKPGPEKTPFQLIGILGISSLDNVFAVSDDATKDSGTKAVITVVPQYDIPLAVDSKLRLRAIVLREKFSKEDFKTVEISYTQLAVQWLKQKIMGGNLTVEGGMNDIRTDNTAISIGEEQSSTEIYVNGVYKQALSKQLAWDAKVQYKQKDSIPEVANVNDEADAREISLKAGIFYTDPAYKGNGKIGYASNDALGKYQDSTTVTYSIKVDFPMGDWIPSVGYSGRQKTQAIEDERVALTPTVSSGTVTAKVNYKLFAKTQLSFSYQMKNQTSNVDTQNFTLNTATLSVIHLF